jgi:hypothetical protein
MTFENLLRFFNDRLRPLLANGLRRAQVLRDWYREAGCTGTEARAIKLLKEWLSAKQLAQFNAHRYFDVIGCHTGKNYRICYGTATNIYELDYAGRPRSVLCFVPNRPLAAGDVMLAQKIALETDEWSAVAVAKRFAPSWH